MTVEEVEALGGSKSSFSTSGCNTNGYNWINTTSYWLGTASATSNVVVVEGRQDFMGGFGCTYGDGCGVRPVVEILKSNIS